MRWRLNQSPILPSFPNNPACCSMVRLYNATQHEGLVMVCTMDGKSDSTNHSQETSRPAQSFLLTFELFVHCLWSSSVCTTPFIQLRTCNSTTMNCTCIKQNTATISNSVPYSTTIHVNVCVLGCKVCI